MAVDFKYLLQGKHDCQCGRDHNCELKNIVLGSGALKELPALAGGFNSILFVADNNTDALCGESVRILLGEKCRKELIYQTTGVLVPNEKAIAELDAMVTPEIDLIVGLGSGVINDLCKYASFTHHIDYFIIATAPSMDGYASCHAAMIIGGMKVTYSAHMAHSIIADVDILRTAPEEMLRSGYGDILGKYSALNDWKLGHVMYDEYFCQNVYDLIYETTKGVEPIGRSLMQRDPEAVRLLMEAILVVGVAMSWIGNSRPASGSEHHLSHFYEVLGLLNDTPYFLHGVNVAYSTVETELMREEILALSSPAASVNSMSRETEIRRVYGSAAEGVIELQNKAGWYEQDMLTLIQNKWDAIRDTLHEVPDSKWLIHCIESVGLSMDKYYAEYSDGERMDAKRWAKDLKDRYTFLWIWFMLLR